MIKIKTLLTSFAAAVLAAGCAASAKKADEGTDQILGEATQRMTDNGSFNTTARQRVRTEDGVFVSTERIPIQPGLPEVFSQEYSVTMSNIVPLAFAADRLTQLTGYKVAISEDVYDFFKRQQVAATGGATAQNGQQTASRFTGGSNTVGTDIFVDLSYRGPLTGLLDRIAANVTASWEFNAEANTIEFFRYKSVSYKIHGTHARESVQGTITNASTSQAGSSLTTITSGDLDTFDAITRDITAMLSADGKVSVQRALQMVVVTDTPRIHARVREYLDKVNADLKREVFIEVKVLTVQLKDGDTRGINFNLLRSTTGSALQFGTVRDVQGFGTVIGSLLDTASGSLEPWRGSQLIIDALSKQAKVSDVKTVMLRALSGTTAPYQNTKRVGYISQSGTVFSGVGTGVAQNTREVDFETVGFTLRALPNVLEDGKNMMLHLWVSISNLDSLDNVGSGDNIVQIPQVSSNDFQERFGISSGETLVLAGFEQNAFSVDARSMSPNARWWPFGGAANTGADRSVLVFVVTPVVVDGPQSNS